MPFDDDTALGWEFLEIETIAQRSRKGQRGYTGSQIKES